VDFEQLGGGDGDEATLAGGAAWREVVEDVRRTSDVVVVRNAATDAHAAVERRRDEYQLIATARRVETFPLTVLVAHRWTNDKLTS